MTALGGIERLSTGIPGLDEITSGGLPAGRSALIAGTAGSGKTLLAVQFLVAGLVVGEPAVLVTFEERPEELIANAASLGWDLREHLDAGRLAVVDLTAGDETIATGEFDFGALIARVKAAVARTHATRVAIDAVGGLFANFSDGALVRRELARLIETLRMAGATAVVTAERTDEYGPVARYEVEEFVADTVVVLRNPLGRERRRRTIEILKLRGGGHERGEYPFGIDDRRGIIIIPLAALESDRDAVARRVSTGVSSLDDMCSGGVPGDAITLVHGPPGAGKSLLACHFVQAGLDAGERVLHYCFEDSAERLLRHADAIGLSGLRAAEQTGQLSVVARYPERLGLEDLLIGIRRSVTEWQPGRLVIDSLSVLDRVSSGAAFREFVVSLITLVREHQIAALCTHATAQEGADDAITNVSTLADCLIGLRFQAHDGEHRRVLRVIKLRGSSHDLADREYRIDDKGIALTPVTPEPRSTPPLPR